MVEARKNVYGERSNVCLVFHNKLKGEKAKEEEYRGYHK